MGRILIIDDEKPIREMLRQMLERAGHEVSEAEDGENGLRLYRSAPANLVIVDILMPGKGGLATISDLCKDFPKVRILAISGGGRSGKLNFLATAQSFPGVRTLRKPFRRSELLEAVRQALADG